MTAQQWGHVITAMVTPFNNTGEIDDSVFTNLVEYLLANGSDSLVVSGTTGESPTLSGEEKVRLFKLAKTAINGRGSVIAGTGSYDTASSIALSKRAEEAGVDGLLLVTPYYNRPSQEGLYQHFKAVAESVSIPVMLYNVPGRTSVNMSSETALRLANDVSNIVAVKEAGGNIMQISEIVASAPDKFAVYSGDDAMTLPMLAVGAYGVVSVTSHIVGRDMHEMCGAFFEGRMADARRIHAKMLPIVKACFQPTTPSPAPVKAALSLLGLPVGSPRLPLVPANEHETEIVRQTLIKYGMI